MQAGFAFLEAGSVRSKNTTNILFKNLLDTCVGCLAFWACGFAFSGTGNAFIGSTCFLLVGCNDDHLPKWFIMFVFAATSATIVSGAMAERTEFASYIVYTAFSTGDNTTSCNSFKCKSHRLLCCLICPRVSSASCGSLGLVT